MSTDDAVTDMFVKTYADRSYRYPAMVRHNGTLLAFAMDADRRLYYAALDPAAPVPDGGTGPADTRLWPAEAQPLPFAAELASVGFGVADQVALATVRRGSATPVPPGTRLRPDEIDTFLSSTARFTADVPFQVLSDGRYVYVFRQAITDPEPAAVDHARTTLNNPAADASARAKAQALLADHANMAYLTDAGGTPVPDEHGLPIPLVAGTLLVDRFVLVGDVLAAKLEVRFQRSRSRTRPAGAADTLGAADLDQRPFVEPSQQLRFVRGLTDGRFCVALVPTAVAEVFRWQLFAYTAGGAELWSYSVERSDDGLFDTQGSQAYTCPDHPDLYALSAGTCPRPMVGDDTQICGDTLIPRIDIGGASGSALAFPLSGGSVSVRGALAIGPEYTVEAWLRPDPAGRGDRALLSCSTGPELAGPSVYVVDGTAVRTGFGDTHRWYDVTSGPVLTPDAWQHLAISFGDGTLRIYVDGVLRYVTDALAGRFPAATAPEVIGGGFSGVLDELRVWSVALAADDIRIGRHRRLTGLETGLAGYWRLDESTGGTVWDLSPAGASGQLTGARWVTSDAPIAESAGLSRSPVRLLGCTGAGGLSTAVYYRQEPGAAGYDGQAKPVKQAARLLLAAITATGGEEPPSITVLDFGVASDGSLAQLPVAVPVSTLSATGADGDPTALVQAVLAAQTQVAERQDVVLDLAAEVARYEQTLAAIDAAGTIGPQIPVPADFPQVGLDVNALVKAKADLAMLYQPGIGLPDDQKAAQMNADRLVIVAKTTALQTATAQIGTLLATARQALADAQAGLAADRAALGAAERRLNADSSLPMPLLNMDGRGLTVTGATLGFARSADPPTLFDSALGRLMLYFRGTDGQFLVAYYSASTERASWTVPAGTGLLSFLARATDAELDGLRITLSPGATETTCTLEVSLDGPPVTETWNRLPRDGAALAAVLNGTADGPAYDYAADASSSRPGTDLSGGSLLIGVDARIARGDVSLGDATPGGATGACRWFAAAPGTTVDFGGSDTSVAVLAETALALDGSHDGVAVPDAPGLTITGAITVEAWVRPTATDSIRNVLSRGDNDGEVYLRILGNQYQVGCYDGHDHYAAAPVLATDLGKWVHLAGVYDGTTWRLYRNGVPLAATADAVGAIATEPGWAIGMTSDGRSRFFAGDIDEVRIWARSRNAQEITDGMNRRLSGTEAGLAGYWYGNGATFIDHTVNARHGTAHGKPTAAPSPDPLTRLSGFDAAGDRTVEAWVCGTGTGPVSRLLVHRSPDSAYGLAVRTQNTAVHFDGTTDQVIQLADSPALDSITGPVTMEAWIRPNRSDQVRTVVAHGYVPTPAAEVTLRINGGNYETGNWRGANGAAGILVPMDPHDVGTWVHLASVFDGSAWHLYRNGVEIGRKADTLGALAMGQVPWTIGNSLPRDRPFSGEIDEVRIWRVARSAAEIAGGMATRMSGAEPGLVGLWRFDDTGKGQGQPLMRDHTVQQNNAPAFARATGVPGGLPGPGPMYAAVFSVGGQGVETVSAFPARTWTHLAGVFDQSYGVRLAGPGSYLDAGASATLDLDQDLTIEVGVQLDDLASPQGLVSRGTFGDGTDDDVPYALWVNGNGGITFAFEDVAHTPVQFGTPAGAVSAGRFARIAVTRKHFVSVDTDAAKTGTTVVVDSWDDITIYVNGSVASTTHYRGKAAGSCDSGTAIGQVLGSGGLVYSLRGTLAEVRLWSVARDAATVSAPIKGTELGLAAWWRLEDATGTVATDSKAGHPASLRGAAAWVVTPDPNGSALSVLIDGQPQATVPLSRTAVTARPLSAEDPQFSLGALSNAARSELLRGQLEEVRVWRVARTTEQIRNNLFGRLTGDFADLIAYYTMDAGAVLTDGGLHGNDLPIVAAPYVLSTAPIGEDTPLARNVLTGIASRFNRPLASAAAAAEYSALETASDGTPGATFRRAYGYVDPAGAWRLVTGFTVGAMTAEWVGQAQFDPQLIGYLEGAPPVPSENLTAEDTYAGTGSVTLTEATSTTYTYASSRDSGFDSSFELSAGQGAEAQTFVGLMEIEAPLGVGVGQVELTSAVEGGFSVGAKANFEMSLSWLDDSQHGTGLSRTRVSSLSLTGNKEQTPEHTAVGARFVPDNVGFALVQSQTADVFALRLAHTGALIAYQMRPNPDIPTDWNIITFPINPLYTKQGVLDGKVGGDADRDYPNAGRYSPDISYFKPIEAYALKNQIQREEQELTTLFAQRSVDPNQLSGGTLPTAGLPTRQNLVNTYVWTADGGQFAETEQGMDTYAENASGAYAFAGMAGLSANLDVSIFGAAVSFELTAMFGGHLNLSITKTADSEHEFGVDASVAPDTDITAVVGTQRVKVPGKVDAYRWMTFYLAPRPENHDLFFNQVVDPIWLAQSGDAPAVALRQARQDTKRPAAWRVLHRVTYVSRVLAPLSDQSPPLEQALHKLDIASNYELIRTLEPLVRGRTARYADFEPAVRTAVLRYLPDLSADVDQILAYLVLYYGIPDAPQLTA